MIYNYPKFDILLKTQGGLPIQTGVVNRPKLILKSLIPLISIRFINFKTELKV